MARHGRLHSLNALAATLLLAYVCLRSAAAKAPSPFSPLCQAKKITSESQWRACALRTVQDWNNATLKVINSNLTTVMQELSGIIDPNLVLRLEPVGTFAGVDMIAEYLTIFAAPTGPATIIKPTAVAIRRFTGLRPIAVATVDFLFVNVFNGLASNLTVDQWFRFNEFNRIANADFVVNRFVEFVASLQLDAVLAANPNISTSIITGVCQIASTFCAAPGLQQYADFNACLGFLASVPFINPLRTAANSVLCRFVHATLVPYAPQIHCSHIGPSGGGACVDEPYSSYFTASPFAPGTFLSS